MKTNREKVIGLLDYVEQVVRLDERVAMRVQDYRLSDGSTFSIREDDTRGLPGIRHDIRLDDLPIWLEIERLSRQSPPTPDQQIAEWLVVSNDPARQPELLAERIVTVDAGGRDKAIEEGRVLTEDIFTAPRAKGEAHNAPKKFDLRLKLSNHPTVEHEAGQWISNVWRKWADEEIPRRRTIKLYQKLYKLLQQVESAGAESPVEVVWGVGNVTWEKSQHLIDRPLLECRVDIEIDDKKGGAIRIRPTGLDVSFDLKPYEEVGCQGLPMLADLIRRELSREKNDEGVSPFVRDSFEPILSAAANRIDPDGIYLPDLTDGDRKKVGLEKNLAISDQWVLFARPRSQHIVLQDIDRLRRAASKDDASVGTIAERLVTEPSEVASGEGWSPLASAIGVTQLETGSTNSPSPLGDVFFPKPFNDDQLEIVKKLSRSDGVVVQGPPGTGKTHTIANLICHAMATGQRVLVVSRGEPALAVLRDQLPKEVRPLAIAILSSERQGLMQIESAIREIQSVVDASNPEQRLKKISRLESEIVELRRQIEKAEAELESIAIAHLSKVGPRKETPAELARRIVTEREKYQWFVDRPQKFASETDLTDDALVSLQAAVTDVGNLIDHLGIELPSVLDLPTQNEVGRWHHELQQARALHETMMTASESPVRMGAVDLSTSEKLATTLENLVKCSETASSLPWLNPILEAAALGHEDQWLDLLRDRISEWERLEVDRIKFANYVAQFPRGIIENEEARAAVSRAARGERLWPLFTIGKSEARSLVGGIKINGKSIDGADVDIWKHVEERLEFHARNIDADVKWHGFLNAIRASAESFRDSRPSVAGCLRAVENAVAMKDALTKIAPGSPEIAQLIRDSEVARNLIVQIRAMIGATELGSTRDKIDRVLSKFAGKLDRTSGAIQQLFNDVVGRSEVTPEQVVSVWRSTLQRLQLLASLRPAMGTIERISGEIEREGAPTLARQIRSKGAVSEEWECFRGKWRDVWDFAAADSLLERIDARSRLQVIAKDREENEKRLGATFAELVRERTFFELERRLSPSIKTALVQFVRSLARVGKGTGKSAGSHRRSARDALAKCYGAIPCWIMPTWRVAEQLPAELGSVDLIIVDEASQSDVTELPVLLRGKKVLIVGDDRQVSPTAPFVTHAKIQQLKHHFLGEVPFGSLLEPGESLYDLSRAVFPDNRLMLKEHFRCVEPIIRFSMQFYPEKMIPLRIPRASERLDPPLVDIFIPHGVREPHRKINKDEADVIVDEIERLTAQSAMADRTIGVISLIGAEQAEFIRNLLSERIGEELMQRHSILCGDSATFQGNERHVVFLSMVADSKHNTSLTMSRYEQRFNVAASRARDRLYLVRSVQRGAKVDDLKNRLIAHFEEPMPLESGAADDIFDQCDSGFERDMLRRLLDRGYAVRPQVGALGYRIDLVVDGRDGRRLAIECDGDRFHGPEQWRDDMRRQRTLERVGWRFWRCFASSYYRDPEGVFSDLELTLERAGINPSKDDNFFATARYTEHRVVGDGRNALEINRESEVSPREKMDVALTELPSSETEIGVGDRVHLVFSNGSKRLPVELSNDHNDPDNGFISVVSPLGRAVVGVDDGDEIDVEFEGRAQKVLVELIGRRAS